MGAGCGSSREGSHCFWGTSICPPAWLTSGDPMQEGQEGAQGACSPGSFPEGSQLLSGGPLPQYSFSCFQQLLPSFPLKPGSSKVASCPPHLGIALSLGMSLHPTHTFANSPQIILTGVQCSAGTLRNTVAPAWAGRQEGGLLCRYLREVCSLQRGLPVQRPGEGKLHPNFFFFF